MLEKAGTQTIEYDDRSTPEYQQGLIDELGDSLSFRPESRTKWYSNYIADFYKGRIEDKDVLLKIVVGKPRERADEQYAALRDLYDTGASAGFHLPEPIHLVEGRSAYVMGFVKGTLMSRALVDRHASREQIVEAAARCGRALAAIHDRWTDPARSAPVDQMIGELHERSPWKLSAAERALIDGVRSTWADRKSPEVRLYMDFDPVNVLLDASGEPVLIDPPEEDVRGAWHWDVGTFTMGVERAWWRSPWKLPLASPTLKAARDAFLAGYEQGRGTPFDDADRMLIAVCERIRLAQLSLWWRTPRAYRHGLKSWARDFYSRPLIHRTQRKQLRRLASMIERHG